MSDRSSAVATSSSSGIGFAGLLTIAFIVLKLCNVIDWSWLWVLAPLWISFGLGMTFLVLVLFLTLVAAIFSR